MSGVESRKPLRKSCRSLSKQLAATATGKKEEKEKAAYMVAPSCLQSYNLQLTKNVIYNGVFFF
jgi:hypothetical protein